MLRPWFRWVLPGLGLIGLVIATRLTGSLQFLEWVAFDLALKLRLDEPTDERIVIVGIGEADLAEIGTFPIPDQEIANLIRNLQAYEPAVIGLDLFRSLAIEPGSESLRQLIAQSNNLITVERILRPQIQPPSSAPRKRVGFSDILLDGDNHVRRSLLGSPNPDDLSNEQDYRFALAQRLAMTYLRPLRVSFGNGWRDPQTMRFGTTELPRLLPNSGSYVGLDAGGMQSLLNYRSGSMPFRFISRQALLAGDVDPDWLRGQIVILGMAVPSDPNTLRTGAIASLNPNPNRMYGVEFQAHATSQILSAVLDGRPLMRTWQDAWEYLWILGWGLLGIYLSRWIRTPTWSLVGLLSALLGVVGISTLLLWVGWWVPLIPAGLVLLGNGLSYTVFMQYDRLLRSRIDERRRTIEQTFNVIHNGPLQTLATILRRVQDQTLTQAELLQALANLNSEIRELGEHLKQGVLSQEESLYLRSGLKLDLNPPLHELLYEVYSTTLERDFPGFKTLKVKARSFDPLKDHTLSLEQKRELCRFLEESLCNVGKHAEGATRLSVTGEVNQGWYVLRILDNGPGLISTKEGEGTKQCLRLKHQLKGRFKRESIHPRGTLCELMWPVTPWLPWRYSNE
nr:CHASE2 domain-containing protein [Petrachloros mirabilis]